MDTLRGQFDSLADSGQEPDDELDRELPPASIGSDERRMQVRAYNHWASLLSDCNFPAIEDLEPDALPDFGPYSVLLDFTNGIENPGIAYLGNKLAGECGAPAEEMATLADVPSRSLLSRITDHYMQILANQAPIGFEAEFVNQRSQTILYRGILLPFSSDDDTIDFIFGVINWKELADQQASDELLLEIDQALESKPVSAPAIDMLEPLTDWADGPVSVPANDVGYEPAGDLPGPSFGFVDRQPLEAEEPFDLHQALELDRSPEQEPSYDDEGELDPEDEPAATATSSQDGFASLIPGAASGPPRKKPILIDTTADVGADEFKSLAHAYGAIPTAYQPPEDFGPENALPEIAPAEIGLGDWLAAAREMAVAARSSEDRTRNALYEAIGRAYDFSLAAAAAPEEFTQLLANGGLTMQDRAPLTPVVKLVFGAEYDKTRLTEYAAALSHAHRMALPQGALGEFLAQAQGGLKGVVKAERRLRCEETGKTVESQNAPRHALARKLRALPPQDFTAIAGKGREFALVMIRRTDEGAVMVLGEVPDDVALVEKAARRLIG